MNASIAAIVLAAGASRRLGQPKQLLMLDRETLLERAIRLACEAGATPVLVVLGANRNAILASSKLNPNSIPVINDHWESGISTSIHAGLKELGELAPNARGVLLLSCDQPRLNLTHLRHSIEAFAAQAEPSIVASAYAGTLGIPAVFPRITFPALQAVRGDKGARALLLEPLCPLIALPFPGGEIDIDRPEDLKQLE